ncbi:MAG: hypothetical protein BZY88_00540 [SAR202 cluster bacterium Io17-Chloro-G9]|nr:MAG: hypothetical protein BZY88_00540 [SAR202 cluster bacterium Io17-Chloro-G9]
MAEVSVDTHVTRRDVSKYHVVKQEGIEVLVSQDLAPSLRRLYIDLKKFLFFRNLTAAVELSNGLVLGRAMARPANQVSGQAHNHARR